MNDAKALERRLEAEDRLDDANLIAALRRSAQSAQSALKVIHRDNMELRQTLGLPSFVDAELSRTKGAP
ncbi:MAG: hypothetical protein AAGF30_00450 [Pseudomonadota bacterium]